MDAADKFDGAIELLVTLDPVKGGKRGRRSKPKSVKKWLNVYVDYKNIAKTQVPNRIAKLGGPWGRCKFADDNQSFKFHPQDTRSGREHAHASRLFDGVKGNVLGIVGRLK